MKFNQPTSPDIELFKAGQILSKTFKTKIYNEDCLAAIKECDIEEGDRVSIHNHDHEFKPSSNLTPYVLLIALSIHGLFEGIALGLQQDDQSTIFLAIAILSHKWAESFTLGISFYKSNIDEVLYTRLILIFSAFSPVGILIGLFVNNSSVLMEAIFLSLSGGTFLYIAASEIIIEEFSVSKNKYSKFIIYILGCLFVALLALVEALSEIDG